MRMERKGRSLLHRDGFRMLLRLFCRCYWKAFLFSERWLGYSPLRYLGAPQMASRQLAKTDRSPRG